MKLLKVIFVILLLVTLGEVGYYGYISWRQTKSARPESYQLSQNVSFTNRSVAEEIKQKNAVLAKDIEESMAIFYRNWFQNHDDEKFYLTLEQPGVVNTIFTKEDSTIMLITNDKGEKISGFTIDENIRFYKIINKEKVSIPFLEVKIGDKIIIRVERNMITGEEDMEFIIAKP